MASQFGNGTLYANLLNMSIAENMHSCALCDIGNKTRIGIHNTVDLLSEHFYFDKLPSIVSEYVQSCHDCQTRKMTHAEYV
jgi:hypothetical protein